MIDITLPMCNYIGLYELPAKVSHIIHGINH